MELRWVYLAVSVLISTCCAINYAYAVLTDTLRNEFGFSQTQVDTIGTVGNVGQYFGLIAGIVYDRYGPKVSLYVAAFCIFTGFGSLTIALSGAIPNPSVTVIAFCYFIGSQSQPWLDNAAVVTNLHNFPHDTGLAVGLSTAFNGLGASVFGLMYTGAFAPSALAYLLFITIIPTCIALAASLIAKRVDNDERSTPTTRFRFYYGYLVTLALIIFCAGVSLYDALVGFSSAAKGGSVAGLVVFYLAYLYIPFAPSNTRADPTAETPSRRYQKLSTPSRSLHNHVEDTRRRPAVLNTIDEREGDGDDHDGDDHDGGDDHDAHHHDDEDHHHDDDHHHHHHHHNHNLNRMRDPEDFKALLGDMSMAKALWTSEFWLVFIATTIVAGSGLAVINNLAQMQEALTLHGKKDESTTSVLVTVVAIGSCCGRLGIGGIASVWKRREKWSVLLCITTMVMTACCLWITWIRTISRLYWACLGVGIAFGMLAAIVVPLLLDLFGPRKIASIYAVLNFAPMMGSLTMATGMAGMLYDHQKTLQNKKEDETCEGVRCFRMAFLGISALGILSIACAYLLWAMGYSDCDLSDGFGIPGGSGGGGFRMSISEHDGEDEMLQDVKVMRVEPEQDSDEDAKAFPIDRPAIRPERPLVST
mmetsp:Transcript_1030/g.1949  ORF Transcript_1030/g.1949 Transcript_1030/m.1949 type:complete len:645 (-) Transcript_1030:280-2214(-)